MKERVARLRTQREPGKVKAGGVGAREHGSGAPGANGMVP